MELMVPKGTRVRMVWDYLGRRVKLDHKGTLETLGSKVIKEFRVQLAQRDSLAQKVFKVRRVLKEMMDPLVALVNLGCQVPTDNEESKEIKEILVGMAHQEKKGKKETRVQLELQVIEARLVLEAQKGNLE